MGHIFKYYPSVNSISFLWHCITQSTSVTQKMYLFIYFSCLRLFFISVKFSGVNRQVLFYHWDLPLQPGNRIVQKTAETPAGEMLSVTYSYTDFLYIKWRNYDHSRANINYQATKSLKSHKKHLIIKLSNLQQGWKKQPIAVCTWFESKGAKCSESEILLLQFVYIGCVQNHILTYYS